jgi:hypothetical protein
MQWSDGVERGQQYDGDALNRSIRKYFEDRLEEELIGLRWENEWLRQQVTEMALLKIQSHRVKVAAAA